MPYLFLKVYFFCGDELTFDKVSEALGLILELFFKYTDAIKSKNNKDMISY